MELARNYNYLLIGDFINKAILIIDPPRPKPLQLVLQRLRLTCPRKRIPLDILDQPYYPCVDLLVPRRPPCKILKRTRNKRDPSHILSGSTYLYPFLFSDSRKDSMR